MWVIIRAARIAAAPSVSLAVSDRALSGDARTTKRTRCNTCRTVFVSRMSRSCRSSCGVIRSPPSNPYRDGIHVSHLPVLLDPQRVCTERLSDTWPARMRTGAISMAKTGTTCVFHGPHAYISPTWYTKRPAVPTWNYAVVHAIGTPTVIDDEQRLAQVIDETLGTFEPALREAAADGYLPEAYRAPLLPGDRQAPIC